MKTDCSWAGGVVSATIAPGMRATLTVSGGLIRFGAPATGCGGAITSNTDRIVVEGATDTPETLVIDLRGGPLAPGATPETGQSEIEVDVNLHDVVDLIRVIGTNSGASLAVGSRGISLNRDDDVDIPIDPDPIMVSLVGGCGQDRLTAAGGFGAGGRFAGSADLHGGGSADVLVGGKGRDRMWGGEGPDALRAVDHKRDREVGLARRTGHRVLRPRARRAGRLRAPPAPRRIDRARPHGERLTSARGPCPCSACSTPKLSTRATTTLCFATRTRVRRSTRASSAATTCGRR